MVNTYAKHIFLFISASAAALLLWIGSFRIYQVKEHSMEPILHNGQTIIMLKKKTPHQGDIIIYENPDDKKLVVKRCILSPGDPVNISGGYLITEYIKIPLTAKQEKKLTGVDFIPKDMFFAIGDNIFNSHDSRDYGPIFIDNLKGKVLLIK